MTFIAAQAPDDRPEPDEIPGYELLRRVGRGRFGEVWLARERASDMRRVVKLVSKAQRECAERDIEGVRKYQRYVDNHPHLMQILIVGETEHRYYYTMEPADNRLAGTVGSYEPATLRTYLYAAGRLGARGALDLVRKLLSGVACLHEQGLAHCDLKPENVLMVKGAPKLADMGLVASLDATPPRAGTPGYVTPEGEANDRYALGKILYELISGRPAVDFPRLPGDILDESTPELKAAVEIANRACHPQADRRFGSLAELERALDRALRLGRSRWRFWHRLSTRWRAAAVVGLAVVLVSLIALGTTLYARIVPCLRDEQTLDLVADGVLMPIRQTPEDEAAQPYYPYLRVSGSPLPTAAGQYAVELAQPSENFCVEAHLRFRRPWGGLEIGVAAQADGGGGVGVAFAGQPDGEGLCTWLFRTGPLGERLAESSPIVGQPHPGIEYVLRLARTRDGAAMTLWPLARASTEPLVRRVKLPAQGLMVRYLTLSCGSGDPYADVELLSVRYQAYSMPLVSLEEPLPEVVETGVVPALVSPVLPEFEWPGPGCNLLAPPYHPYDSGAWTQIGSWSWWGNTHPEAAVVTPIRSVPFSSAKRRERTHEAFYAGYQLLRLDLGEIADFQARVRVNLINPDPQYTVFDPWLTPSHGGRVGLAFRLQDDASEGRAWGAGYVLGLDVDQGRATRPDARLERVGGFVLSAGVSASGGDLTPVAAEVALCQRGTDVCGREEMLNPEGFEFVVRAVGGHFELSLGRPDDPVFQYDDPNPLPAGRIALYTCRLIATFESLEVTPLPAD